MGRPTRIRTERILEVARRIFLEQGHGASTAAIAREAGVSEGSIFKRFPTKDDLFGAAMGLPELRWADALAERAGDGDVRVELVEVALQIVGYFRELIPVLMMRWATPGCDAATYMREAPSPAPDRSRARAGAGDASRSGGAGTRAHRCAPQLRLPGDHGAGRRGALAGGRLRPPDRGHAVGGDRSMTAGHVVRLGVLTALLGACSMHTVKTRHEPPVRLPAAYGGGAKGPAPERWWQDFRDERLTGMVTRVLRENLDLARAWARLDQARAALSAADAGVWPQLSVSVRGGKSNQANQFFGRVESDSYGLTLGASYEVDLWGKVKNARGAATRELAATRADLETQAVTLAAEVAETWFSLLEARAQAGLLKAQMAVNQTYLDLIRARFDQGQASAVEVFQQRQQVIATRARLPLAEASARVMQHRLAVLLGKAPRSAGIPDGDALPDLPAVPGTGVPSDLLKRRPDLRAAHDRLVAADHRVGIAVADRYPSLKLSGSIGFQTTDIVNLFTDWIQTAAAELLAPIVDGGRKAAEEERARAVVRELLLTYGKAVLTALREVEDALTQEERQRAHIESLDAQLDVGRATLREARNRYVNGLSDYLVVLTAIRSLQQAELERLHAHRQLISYRVQLYRALGGTWTKGLKRP